MSAPSIISRFVNEPDTGSEYKLRYEKSQKGQIEYARRLMENFQTIAATREGRFQRTDAAVSAAFGDEKTNAAWRSSYAMLPHDAIQIISRWVKRMLKSGDDYDVMAAACFVFASRSTIEIVPTIEDYCGLLCACWTTTEKTGKPRLIPLPYQGITKSVRKISS